MIKRWLLILQLGAGLLLPLPFTAPAAESPTARPATAQATPAGAQVFDPVAATKAWLDSVPAEKRAKSDAYFEGGYWLLLWNFLLGAAISLLLLNTRISARLRDFAERRTRFKSLQILLYAIPYLLLTALLTFPLTVYQDFFREHAYGLATQTFSPWFREQMLALTISTLGLTIVLVVIYAVIRHAPRTWWLWGAGIATAFLLLTMIITPVYIAPLFNAYKPLTDPAISQSILAMARANQIPVDQVFQFDASRQSNRVGANVSGFLGTTRISLNDNLLKQCTLPEIRSVMAHEMGHYVLNHGAKLAIADGLFALLAFAIAPMAFEAGRRRWGDRWGVRGIADPAGLPLLLLIFITLFFLLTPFTNSVARTIEREADSFGINTSREPAGMAKVALKLGAYRKLNPGPLENLIYSTIRVGVLAFAWRWIGKRLCCPQENRARR
jgi:STE24 endopeptidase